MKPKAVKSFPLELWDKVRLSAHQTGKRYGWTFSTRRDGEKIFVTRVK